MTEQVTEIWTFYTYNAAEAWADDHGVLHCNITYDIDTGMWDVPLNLWEG